MKKLMTLRSLQTCAYIRQFIVLLLFICSINTVLAGTRVPSTLLNNCLLFSDNILFLAAGMPPVIPFPEAAMPLIKDIEEFYMNSESINNPLELQMYILDKCIDNDGDLTKLVPVRKKDAI